MLLILTYFHMYWILSVLQDIYIKYMGSIVKMRNIESVMQILHQRTKLPRGLKGRHIATGPRDLSPVRKA